MSENKQSSLTDQMNKHITGMHSFLFNKKSIYIILGFLLFSVMATSNLMDKSNYSHDEREIKLAKIICNIEGVKKAEVMINYELTNDEKIIDNNSAVGFEELYMNKKQNDNMKTSIAGVVVVAKGADNYMVKMNILDGVKTALNIPASKIEVLNMK